MNKHLLLLLILGFSAFSQASSAFAQDDLPAPPGDDTPVDQQTAVSSEEEAPPSTTIRLDATMVRHILEQSTLNTPYEVTCAPVGLNSEMKNKYNAFTVSVTPSKAQDAPPAAYGKTLVIALNASASEAAQVYRKSFFNAVAGRGLNTLVDMAPSVLAIMFGNSPRVFGPSILTAASSVIPAVKGGVLDYGGSKASRKEAAYYDGIFRSFEEHLKHSATYAQNLKCRKQKNRTQDSGNLLYTQLPLYSNMIINKESNNGKPIIQVTDAKGQSWSYRLNCDRYQETGV